MIWRNVVFPLLSQFDAEKVHEFSLKVLSHPIAPSLLNFWSPKPLQKPIELCGLIFRTPVGLAAGFDKNAIALPALQKLFGFIEVGTVTPEAQPGNPKPRIFRLPEDGALINRLGFNNEGAEAVAERLKRVAKYIKVPIGGSLGKMRSTPNEEAAQDYVKVHLTLRPWLDYSVTNISSPNTPGLRDLQNKRNLEKFLCTVVGAEKEAARIRGERPKPIFVKFSPDMSPQEAADAFEVCVLAGIAAIIIGNTTLYRENLTSPHRQEMGGVSGAPLTERVQMLVAFLRKLDSRFPLIGVGGIMEPHHASILFDLGVNLVQLYSGFIYGGPAFPRRVVNHVQRYR